MTIRSKSTRSVPALSRKDGTVILGGGLAGLSTGCVLARAGRPVVVFESDSIVGGLSKTIVQGEFRFDLGGHRFITKNRKVRYFVSDLLNGEFLTVTRKSKIYMRQKFVDYPLKPSNAVFGLGMHTTLKAIYDYGREKIRNLFGDRDIVSLEDWVVSNFGRTMFNLYFKEYSEKVWGIECRRISKEWVAQRIRGLSMWTTMKNAIFKFSGRDIETLADEFIYPRTGIGRISDRLKEEIEKENTVFTDTRISKITHEGFTIKSVTAGNIQNKNISTPGSSNGAYDIEGREFVSSIPLTNFVQMLAPGPPEDILEAASNLKYRDLVVVVTMLDCEKVTDLTWLYLPEKNMPIGRIHEPKNWSPDMAPEGKTHIVSEYFCFEGDNIWKSSDKELASLTVAQLEDIGFISGKDVINSYVVRVPKAYPLFEVGYEKYYIKITDYLKKFSNLNITGRSGMFRYYNMDIAMESGITVAEDILDKLHN